MKTLAWRERRRKGKEVRVKEMRENLVVCVRKGRNNGKKKMKVEQERQGWYRYWIWEEGRARYVNKKEKRKGE